MSLLENSDEVDRTMRFRIEGADVLPTRRRRLLFSTPLSIRRAAASRSETTPVVDDLLPYYNRELTYIRRLSAEFAAEHPKIAGRLRLSQDAIEDPHVERLIQAFAFLTARSPAQAGRRNSGADGGASQRPLSALSGAHFASMAIAQFSCPPDLTVSHTVPAGTEIETEPMAGETCRFRTCYPTTLWPITVEAASLRGRPIVAPANPQASGAVAVLRLTLRCLGDQMTFTKLGPDRLRFFLRGQPQLVLPLYELLFNNAVSVALADSAADPAPDVSLRPDCIRPVGFDKSEGHAALSGAFLRRLSAADGIFHVPEKFLFFDLTQLSAKILLEAKNKLDVFIYLNKSSTDLERSISDDAFAVGCTPIVNLFRQRAEPIADAVDLGVPGGARCAAPGVTEVYSVDAVSSTGPDGTETSFLPFYSIKHAAAAQRASAPSGIPAVGLRAVAIPAPSCSCRWSISTSIRRSGRYGASVETTCLNRDLPGRLPYGGGHPHLQLVEAMAGVASLRCITAPTPTVRAPLRHRALWRLVSHSQPQSLVHRRTREGRRRGAARDPEAL